MDLPEKFPDVGSLTKDQINTFPVAGFNGPIEVVETDSMAAAACDELLGHKILGFDTETRPSFKRGQVHTVSLLQLATEHKVFLFRLKKLTDFRPVAKVLATPGIIKVGVAIRDDIKQLQKKITMRPGGFIELQEFVKKYGIESFGLRTLPPLVLGFRISKNFQLSNWESEILNEGQQKYAATDAWVSLMIYNKLLEMGDIYVKPVEPAQE
jgi:ribonuclease D